MKDIMRRFLSSFLFASFYFNYISEAKSCSGTAIYTLTFKAKWTRQSHADFPRGPHFSPLVGCSHKSSYVMWAPGKLATTGVKNVAEFGSPTTLNTEMQQQITSKNAHKRYQGRGISGGTGTTSIPSIEVNTEYPLVSFISMIAPSPDWFLGVRDYDLCDATSGKWLDRRVRELPLYDAGTDSGPGFESLDSVTSPPQAISLITNNTEGSLKGSEPLKPFGTFTFVKTLERDVNLTSPSTGMNETTPTPSNTSTAGSCSGTATYNLTFRAEWTPQSHADFPPGPHFSPLVGCSHKSSYVMWAPGMLATTGVKNVAEFGSPTTLNTEMQRQISLKNAHQRYQGRGISGGTGTTSIPNIEVNTEYPLVSFISMIAPSPDWFLGVRDYDLCDATSGKWLDRRVRELPLYDAGTDSGPRFESLDSVTNPPQAISLITNNTEGSLQGSEPLKPFGTFTFIKTSESGVPDNAHINTNLLVLVSGFTLFKYFF